MTEVISYEDQADALSQIGGVSSLCAQLSNLELRDKVIVKFGGRELLIQFIKNGREDLMQFFRSTKTVAGEGVEAMNAADEILKILNAPLAA